MLFKRHLTAGIALTLGLVVDRVGAGSPTEHASGPGEEGRACPGGHGTCGRV